MPHTVYLIGAGLTKSLAVPSHPIPLMKDFLHVMADYDKRDNEGVILAALVDLERAGIYRWRDERLTRMAGNCFGEIKENDENRRVFIELTRNRPAESIEDLMKQVASVVVGGEISEGVQYSARAIPERFLFGINQVFSIIGWNVEWAPLERFLEKQFKNAGESHTFVSFNYDLILDRCVQRASNRFWRPTDGYGFCTRGFVTDPSTPNLVSAQLFDRPEPSGGKITVLKPHGSLNFLLPYTDQPNWHFDRNAVPVVPLDSTGDIRYWLRRGNSDLTLVSEENACSQFHRIFIVPPVDKKAIDIEFVSRTMERESLALEDADTVFVIGYSQPTTDADQGDRICVAMKKRDKPVNRLVVVNSGESVEYFERIACEFRFPRNKMEIYNCGFVEFVEAFER